jgi:23S rRNA (adenine2503-C2)-methyltransferase
MSPEELIEFVSSIGERPFRGKQLSVWLFKKGVFDLSLMTDISQSARKIISENSSVHPPMTLEKVIASPDGTKRLLFKLPGAYPGASPGAPREDRSDSPEKNNYIESVIIPEEDHLTLCLSSQIGCAMACAFCRTGAMGFRRNLSQGEILFQITEAKKAIKSEKDKSLSDKKITNLVFMGMGEPLLNIENLLKAIGVITDPELMAYPNRRTTVSTMGIASGIKTLGERSRVNLALSLNAADEALRKKLMPKSSSLSELKESLRNYPLKTGRRITIAWVLLKDVNDSQTDAKNLVKFIHGLKVKVNLIPFNPWPGAPFQRPDPKKTEKFRLTLLEKNVTAIIRKSAGVEINAACGQLAGAEA